MINYLVKLNMTSLHLILNHYLVKIYLILVKMKKMNVKSATKDHNTTKLLKLNLNS
jgi:hypothetical protein